MRLRKIICASALVMAFGFLTSCSSKLNLTAGSDNGVNVDFNMIMGSALTNTIKQLTSNMGGGEQGIFSAQVMKDAFVDSDFTNVKVSNPTKNSMSFNGNLPPDNKQTHASGNLRAVDFVVCRDNGMYLRLSPSSLKGFADGLPDDTHNYLDLFMAPVFTGEEMSKADYKMLIASIYGNQIAAELDNSIITINLMPPKGKNISKASVPKDGTADASKASFSIPLMDFLCLTDDAVYSIVWN